MVPVEEGRLLATLIPDADFVVLESANHILLGHEPAWMRSSLRSRRFLERTPIPVFRSMSPISAHASSRCSSSCRRA